MGKYPRPHAVAIKRAKRGSRCGPAGDGAAGTDREASAFVFIRFELERVSLGIFGFGFVH
jgi:hypothetical protein